MKWIKYVEYLLLAICVAVFVIFLIQGQAAVGLMLNWMYIILGLALIVAIVFPLIGLFSNPKGALKTLILLVICAGIVFACYAIAGTDPITLSDNTVVDNTFTLKVTDAGLYLAYIAFAGAVLTVIFGEVRNAFLK